MIALLYGPTAQCNVVSHEVRHMPVSFLPCITPVFLVGLPLLLLLRSRRAAVAGLIASAALLAVFLSSVYVPGWRLYAAARAGDPVAQYNYAQWTENHGEQVGDVVPLPVDSDVLGGYSWLAKSAAGNYPPAVWLVGVRLKHGIHVPRPAGWTGPGGNWYPQPERGQPMIDRATNELHYRPNLSGYSPDVAEASFYWQHYRRGLPP